MHAQIEKFSDYGARLRSGINTIEFHTCPGLVWESDKNTRKHHTQESREVTLSQKVNTRLQGTDSMTDKQTRKTK